MHDQSINAAKLRVAEQLMSEVRDTLNQNKYKCECCGLTVYEIEKEWTQRQMLNAAIQRVNKIIKEMK